MMKPCFILQLKIDRDLAILRTGKFPFTNAGRDLSRIWKIF